jgi:uncharacterized protein YdaT
LARLPRIVHCSWRELDRCRPSGGGSVREKHGTQIDKLLATISGRVANASEGGPKFELGIGPSLRMPGRGHRAGDVGLGQDSRASLADWKHPAAELDEQAGGDIFAEAIARSRNHRAALKANVRLSQLNKTLRRRAVDLAVSNRHLKQGIVQRKAVEIALKKSREHYKKLLRESRHLQEHLRHLTHQILSAQEDKRGQISRELHDEIAQTLLGINVRLLTLKKEATFNTEGLKKEIASAQRLVEESVKTVNRFAREFGISHKT